jgi:peptide/nickel transport system ATP-binding protein
MAAGAPLLEVREASRRFVRRADLAARLLALVGAGARDEVVRAVDRVSFSVHRGEVVALVGESGCGKSTLARMVAGLLAPTSGSVRLNGEDVARTRPTPGGIGVQMVFQDPFSSLNPRKRVRDLVGEAPVAHRIVARRDVEAYVASLLARCGIEPSALGRYPHQFSGGQRQRIAIARALAVKPELLVCDEAVSALDVSIQAQILNLFQDLKAGLGLTYLFVSHDLGVVEHISDRVLVMYLGRIVEAAPAPALFGAANHPYTRALLAGVPRIERRRQRFTPVAGEIPSPLDPPSGCHFHPRCAHATARCRAEQPALRAIEPGHLSACHLNDG